MYLLCYVVLWHPVCKNLRFSPNSLKWRWCHRRLLKHEPNLTVMWCILIYIFVFVFL